MIASRALEVTLDTRAAELIRTLQLEPHPEGGYYREIWRSRPTVEPADGRGGRAALTVIYFLLPAGAVSRWHRVRSDEVWQYVEGAPLELFDIPPDNWHLRHVRLSTPATDQQTSVHCVPADWWQAARSLGSYTLTSCTVAPGFDFADFELLAQRPELVTQLGRALPEVSAYV